MKMRVLFKPGVSQSQVDDLIRWVNQDLALRAYREDGESTGQDIVGISGATPANGGDILSTQLQDMAGVQTVQFLAPGPGAR